jgi:hypothetical protein
VERRRGRRAAHRGRLAPGWDGPRWSDIERACGHERARWCAVLAGSGIPAPVAGGEQPAAGDQALSEGHTPGAERDTGGTQRRECRLQPVDVVDERIGVERTHQRTAWAGRADVRATRV